MTLELQHLELPGERIIPELGAPLPEGTVVVSADEHLLELEHLFEDRLPDEYRDRAPKLWRDEQGFHSEFAGIHVPPIPPEDRPGIFDLAERAKDADAEGVDKGILYPQRVLQLARIDDLDLRWECIKIYNAWMAEHLRDYPDRFYGVPILNWWDAENAAANIQTIKDLGFKMMMIPVSPKDVEYNDPKLEPLWTAIEESGMPVSIHIGESLKPESMGPGGLGTTILMTLAGHHFRRVFGLLAFSGVFDRHPNLKVVFAEGGINWIAATLFEADKAYRDYEADLIGREGGFAFLGENGEPVYQRPPHPPSHYWFTNCYATFQDDPVGLEQLDRIGWDRVMWASDYPHYESSLGYSRDAVRAVFNATTVEKAQAIVGGTALKLWNL